MLNQPEHGGDPVDRAMLRCGRQFGVDVNALRSRYSAAGELPFSGALRLQASFRRCDGALTAFVKGAPLQVLERSDRNHDGRPLAAADRAGLLAANDAMAAAGLRVIARAAGPVEASSAEALRGLAFKGFAIS